VPVEYYADAFRNVVPLSKSAPEKIEEARQLRDRAIPASGKAARPSGGPARQPRRVVLS
jgi:hypothetical protein